MSNTEQSVLASEAATAATRTSGIKFTPDAKGLLIMVSIGTLTTTPTFLPSLQVRGGDGSWVTIWTAAAAIAAAGQTSYMLYPGALNGDFTEVDGIAVPGSWRFVLTFGSTGSALTTEVRAHGIG